MSLITARRRLLALVVLALVPTAAAADPAPVVPPLAPTPKNLTPAQVEAANRRLASSIVRRSGEPDWASIAIHHTAAEGGTLASIDAWHKKRFGDPYGVEYQFVIGNGKGAPDGLIEVARWRTKTSGVHAVHPERAPRAITISLAGDLDKRPPSPMQAHAVELLVRHLQALYNIDDVRVTTHNRIDGQISVCPGRQFPMERLQWRLRHDADLSLSDWRDPHASFPMEGPFTDLAGLRASLDWGPTCKAAPIPPGEWQIDKRFAGSGDLSEVRLLRIHGGVGCAANDRLFVALQTTTGWYAQEMGAYRPVRIRPVLKGKQVIGAEIVDVGVVTLRCQLQAGSATCSNGVGPRPSAITSSWRVQARDTDR